jgi:hypothetical protein
MEACEAREHGSESKRKHQVEQIIMQAKEWTRTFEGACGHEATSMSALERTEPRGGER